MMDERTAQAGDIGAVEAREATQATAESSCDPCTGENSLGAVVHSPEANALRAEIIAAGRKLWERQYVDGNGGNISVRIGSRYLLCTPTMVSKGDLKFEDICFSDLEGNILAGNRLRTSELLLHLEIYRANPRARAVVHCHPPHATAFAVTGSVPPVGFISEFELFIGPTALARYETPGTQVFAETVLPYVEDHNTILLANHGVVCWSDTVAHAEWLIEILENYCRTILIAQQIGKPLIPIPEDKIQEILDFKRRAGFPDARMSSASRSFAERQSCAGELDRLIEQVAGRA